MVVHEGAVCSEGDVAAVVAAYLEQAGAGQWLPPARAAHEARTFAAALRIDDLFDASITVPANASQAAPPANGYSRR